MTPERKAIRATLFSLVSNVALAAIKWVAGYLGNSYALIADAIESSADVLSSVLVLVGIRYANRPADEEHPYGYGRIEPLITFVVVGFLVVSAAVIAWESIANIRTPHDLPEAWTLYVLGAIIIWKEISFRIVMKRAKETNSSALKADAWHHRSDAITSVAAFIGISVALYLGAAYAAADDWAALFASAFILFNAYKILRPALGEAMDEHRYDELIARIRAVALQVPGIRGTEKCYIRKAGMRHHVDLHAIVDGELTVREGHAIAHALVDVLKREIPELGLVLVHIEPDR